jgi:cation:H+ antiporter
VFLLSGAVVAAAGVRLARDGDAIADATGLGRAWVGAILVAGATSLPELATDTHAVVQGHVDLAVGDLFGSCMANMAILAVADLLTRQGRILARVALSQAMVGSIAVCLLLIAALGMAGPALGHGTFLGMGPSVLAIGIAYLAGTRLLHRNRAVPSGVEPTPPVGPARSLRAAGTGFAIAAVVITVAAWFLARSAATVAQQLGISQGFVGVLLLAITTSLPEMAVSIAGIRAGSFDLVVGNLLGSNGFNVAVLVLLDAVEGPGRLLATADPQLLVGALFGALLTGLAMLDVLNKSERRWWAIEPGPVILLAVYVLGVVLMFGRS